MDKDTRNAIERATQKARRLLQDDLAAQLEGHFDVLLSGTVEAKPGVHLSARERLQREKIVAAVEHKRAAGMKPDEAVADYIRDVAFTTLNRFVALKMLEARELVQECISRGEQSGGYKEFCGLAPGLALLPDAAGYRLYVESLFDELSVEIKVLFDRRDVASVLWPRRQTFDDLLAILNAQELSGVWAEDETIGWVYQYFNSGDERRAMRDTSQAPRNSRELAVRNQFFTPRYVVQFLTDNTLGRTWYEMRKGDTVLRDRCEYMVRRPSEVFLAEGEKVPPEEPAEGLPQEELLRRTAHVSHRPKKDPRDLKILDPACGSGHFLLYAFDLLLAIYEEAWADPNQPKSETTGRSLAADFPDRRALLREAPVLVLQHNLHGVDIDPRCTQISQLALWMRAQRAFRDLSLPRADRPRIRRSNVVLAEPMPGEDDLLRDFTSSLEDPMLAELFTKLADAMKLAGELGLLLRLEQIVRMPGKGQLELLAPPEERIHSTLLRFLNAAGTDQRTRRRLFADDSDHGLALLELAGKHFDVVLMNPPFGYAPQSCADILKERITDIDALFVSRGVEFLGQGGRLGVITNRTQLMKPALDDFRHKYLLGGRSILEVCADLGQGVLDAMVEAAAFVLADGDGTRGSPAGVFLNCLAAVAKENSLLAIARGETTARVVPLALFTALPDMRISHWLHPHLMKLFTLGRPLVADQHVAFGLSTTDNFRFLRLRWEVLPARIVTYEPRADVDGWVPLAKGGEYALYDGDIHLVVDWRRNGAALRAMPGAPIRNEELYGRPGLTYSKRTASAFSPRVLPAGGIPEVNGPMILPRAQGSLDSLAVLAVCSSRVASYLVDALVAAGDTSTAYGAAKDYIPGVIGLIPLPTGVSVVAQRAIERAVAIRRELDSAEETSADYRGPWSLLVDGMADAKRFARAAERRVKLLVSGIQAACEADQEVEASYRLPADAKEELDRAVGTRPKVGVRTTMEAVFEARELAAISTEDLVRRELSRGNARKDVAKNAYRFDRRLELLAALSGASVDEVGEVLLGEYATGSGVDDELSFAFGSLIGRWSALARQAGAGTEGHQRRAFDSVPRVPPAATPVMSPGSGCGILVDDEGHERDVARVLGILENLGLTADGVAQGPPDVRDFIAHRFFDLHLGRYSQSRRKAPIYWQLATPSASYSIWLYLHAFTADTMYKVQNDYIAPKLGHEEQKLDRLRREYGDSPTASQRKELDTQETFVAELRTFLDEVKRVAPLWRPDLDDGVIINFAPLWRLVPHHRPWQKECKATWDVLADGDYDWSHLAMHLWPERVVPKCTKDRSLAIAHCLEEIFWVEDSDGKWKPRPNPTRPLTDLIKERTSSAVKAALASLASAPKSAEATRGRKGSRYARTSE